MLQETISRRWIYRVILALASILVHIGICPDSFNYTAILHLYCVYAWFVMPKKPTMEENSWFDFSLNISHVMNISLLQRAISLAYIGISALIMEEKDYNPSVFIPIGFPLGSHYCHFTTILLIPAAIYAYALIRNVRLMYDMYVSHSVPFCETTCMQTVYHHHERASSIQMFTMFFYSLYSGQDFVFTAAVLAKAISIGYLSFLYLSPYREATITFLLDWVISPFMLFLERDRASQKENGAFIITLLDAVQEEQVATTWWVHYDECNLPIRHTMTDHKKYWYQGVIVDQSESCMSVALPISDGGRIHTLQNNAARRHSRGEDVISFGCKYMRCIEWTSMNEELFTLPSPRLRVHGVEPLFARSRAVKPNEIVDYFISHCWMDDGKAKFAMLTEVAENFKKANGRYPTFWFDKVRPHYLPCV